MIDGGNGTGPCSQGKACRKCNSDDMTAFPRRTDRSDKGAGLATVDKHSRESAGAFAKSMRKGFLFSIHTFTLRCRHRRQPVLNRPGNTMMITKLVRLGVR